VAVDLFRDAQGALVELAEDTATAAPMSAGTASGCRALRFSHASSMIFWMACMAVFLEF
jgi:hypothetical protein